MAGLRQDATPEDNALSDGAASADVPSRSASLGVWDAASLIVGIVIGASLFRVPADVFGHVPGAAGGLMLWLLGGVLSLAGALCYCELATAYPRMGGDYVYLSRAYGRWMGFLFGWMRFTVIIPANIGAMAFIFAEHARRLNGLDVRWTAPLALAAILGLTALNLGGVVLGKHVQNALTVLKLIGLASIVVAGFTFPAIDAAAGPAIAPKAIEVNYGFALILVLYAYGGWSDAAFVAAEVRDVRRNMPRALLLGLGMIIALYVLVNGAYLSGLGLSGVRETPTPAAELLQRRWGRTGETGVIMIVVMSTLGAINGMIFSGARLTAAMGEEHRALSWLRSAAGAQGNPVRAVLAIGAASVMLVWLVGTDAGTAALSWGFHQVGVHVQLPAGEAGFDTLVTGAAPTFWMFFCLISAALPILRRRDPTIERPFRAPSPWMPLVFGATSLYMLWSSLAYAHLRGLAWLGGGLLVAGGGLYLLSRGKRPSHP